MAARLHLAPVPDRPPRAEASIKVILADDHLMARRNLRLLLDREDGMEVIAEADDLSSVMRHVAARLPHVLILDLRLPSGSSIATIRRLREQVPDTQIVVLTMEEIPAFARQALDAGAVGFVLKDHSDHELATDRGDPSRPNPSQAGTPDAGPTGPLCARTQPDRQLSQLPARRRRAPEAAPEREFLERRIEAQAFRRRGIRVRGSLKARSLRC